MAPAIRPNNTQSRVFTPFALMAAAKTWVTVSDPILGTGGTLSQSHPLVGSSRVFLRVRVLPLLIESTP